MSPKIEQYLTSILGIDGSRALKKALELDPQFEQVLLPRAILSWVSCVSESGWDGSVPGSDHVHLSIAKAEGAFDGTVRIADHQYHYKNANLFQLAGAVSVLIGAPNLEFDEIKDKDLVKLGKSIDQLVKAHYSEQLRKAEPKEPSGGFAPQNAPKLPLPPTGPQPPKTGVSIAKPKMPGHAKLPTKALKLPTLKFGKHELNGNCGICGEMYFRDAQYVGCYCLKELSKSVKSEMLNGSVVLSFGRGWDQDEIINLNNILRGD